MDQAQARFWSTEALALLQQLQASPKGLSGEEAKRSDYGMDKLPGAVGDVVKITVSFEAVKQQPTAQP